MGSECVFFSGSALFPVGRLEGTLHSGGLFHVAEDVEVTSAVATSRCQKMME